MDDSIMNESLSLSNIRTLLKYNETSGKTYHNFIEAILISGSPDEGTDVFIDGVQINEETNEVEFLMSACGSQSIFFIPCKCFSDDILKDAYASLYADYSSEHDSKQ